MIRELVHDPIFLAKKSETATQADMDIAKDLLETLIHHQDGCVGMAANMIGELKRIIAFDNDGEYMVMFNPVIIKKAEQYEAEEGCLSLLGGPRKTKRYNSIKVQYQTQDFKVRIKTFKGFSAQIIQHEIDHCDGVLI
ncbi:MAG: peptide deformylase [Ruminococcaceae bacterium]|nr:peptide deformylase [Oscillospiraceae bacterium]